MSSDSSETLFHADRTPRPSLRMNHIAPLLTLDSVELESDITSRKRAFEEIARIVEHCAGVSHQAAFDALNARERLGSTCLGGGVAIPHGRVKGLDELVIAVLRTKESIAFDTPDNRRARLFFSVLIPEGDPEKYLVVLSEISELLKNRSTKQKLLTLPTPREFCEFVGSWEPPSENDVSEEDYPTEKDEDAAQKSSADKADNYAGASSASPHAPAADRHADV